MQALRILRKLLWIYNLLVSYRFSIALFIVCCGSIMELASVSSRFISSLIDLFALSCAGELSSSSNILWIKMGIEVTYL